jgi:hypothetical protein
MTAPTAKARRRGAGSPAACALVLLSAIALAGGEAAAAVDPTCGTPLGTEAEEGANSAIPTDGNPEHAAVDAARMPGAQRSPQVILSAWGRLVLVAEFKVDEGSNFTWAIQARIHSNTTGWDTPAIWLSSPDTSQYYPQGAHIRPSAVFFNDRVWVVWDAQGSALGGPSDRFIAVRSFDRNLTADVMRAASASDPNRTVQHPALVSAGDRMVLAYSTADGDTQPGDTHIEARTFDGSTFGAALRLSNLSDGYGAGLPAMDSDPSGRVFVAWTAANASGESANLQFAWHDGSLWRAPTTLAELGSAGPTGPSVAAFAGRAYVAYSTARIGEVSGTDSEVRMFAFDPDLEAWQGPTTVNPEPTGGDDAAPTLRATAAGLAIGWSTTEDAVYAFTADPDPVYRLFDGTAFGPVIGLANPYDNNSGASPSFVEVGGHLYAHWMLTPPQNPGDPRGNAREVVRLVSRPPQWYDNLTITYRFPQVSDNGSALVALSAGGLSLEGRAVALRLPDGSLHRAAGGREVSVWAPVNPSAPDFQVLACGLPVTARAEAAGAPATPISPLFVVAVVLTFAAGALLARAVLRRRRARRGP